MSEDHKSEDEFVDGDGPGGESDVEVMEAPQLDDEDAVKISHTEDPADDPDEDKPAEGHEAEAVMAVEDPEPGPHVVTTAVPAVMESGEDEDTDEDAPADEAEAS